MFKYKLINQNASSAKYGKCEICHKDVDSVYSQTEYKKWKYGWFINNNFFGHKDCLLKKRK